MPHRADIRRINHVNEPIAPQTTASMSKWARGVVAWLEKPHFLLICTQFPSIPAELYERGFRPWNLHIDADRAQTAQERSPHFIREKSRFLGRCAPSKSLIAMDFDLLCHLDPRWSIFRFVALNPANGSQIAVPSSPVAPLWTAGRAGAQTPFQRRPNARPIPPPFALAKNKIIA